MKLRAEGGKRTQKRYVRIATRTESHSTHPDPVAHAKAIGYSEEDLKSVPVDTAMGLGCGNPVALLELRQGEIVLDLGCGGGFDAFLAAQRIGPTGRVIGVDVTPEMVKRANESAKKAGLTNIEFKHAPIELLPLDDDSVDVAISNCAMNHCVDKVRAFKEVYRVLKPRGRLCISDLVTTGEISEGALKDEIWGEWLRVAQSRSDYLRAIKDAGFQAVTVECEAAFPMADDNERLKHRIVSIQVTARKH